MPPGRSDETRGDGVGQLRDEEKCPLHPGYLPAACGKEAVSKPI
jgi:hypothetical protein